MTRPYSKVDHLIEWPGHSYTTKAASLWDQTVAIAELGEDAQYPLLRMFTALNRFGRTLRRMYDCPANNYHKHRDDDQLTIRRFTKLYSDEFSLDEDTVLMLINEGIYDEE